MNKRDTIDVKINHLYIQKDLYLPFWRLIVVDTERNEFIYSIHQSKYPKIRHKLENEDLRKYQGGKFRAVIKDIQNGVYTVKWPHVWTKSEVC